MFISRKEFVELQEQVLTLAKQDVTLLERNKELKNKLGLLAEELGYEWVSEAVKDVESPPLGASYFSSYKPKETAVLRWSWKKIKKQPPLPESRE